MMNMVNQEEQSVTLINDNTLTYLINDSTDKLLIIYIYIYSTIETSITFLLIIAIVIFHQLQNHYIHQS